MDPHAKNKPTYSLEKRLSSFAVEKELLQDLENYILRKAKEVEPALLQNEYRSQDIAPGQAYGQYKFTIEDATGAEELSSVVEFHQQYFPNDTKRITLSFHSRTPNSLKITVRFGKEYFFYTNLSISYTGETAREIVAGLASGIQQLLEPYQTANHIFNPHPMVRFALLPLVGASALLLAVALIGSQHFQSGAVLTAIVLLVLYYFLSGALKPHTAFKTRRNENLAKWHFWLTTATLGFLMFTVIMGTFLKKIIEKIS